MLIGLEGYGSGPRVRPPQVSRQQPLSGLLPDEMLTSISEDLESSIAMILITPAPSGLSIFLALLVLALIDTVAASRLNQ